MSLKGFLSFQNRFEIYSKVLHFCCRIVIKRLGRLSRKARKWKVKSVLPFLTKLRWQAKIRIKQSIDKHTHTFSMLGSFDWEWLETSRQHKISKLKFLAKDQFLLRKLIEKIIKQPLKTQLLSSIVYYAVFNVVIVLE